MKHTEVRHRWLGLKSYQEDDSSVFCGRSDEAEQLFRMVQRETLTTVFAPSGTGKTSLLCAGLFPKLRKAGYFPLHLRLQHGVPGIDHEKWLREEIDKSAEQYEIEISSIVPPQADPEEELLWEYLHRIEIWGPGDQLLTPVLVFDQFEEVFTVGSDRPETESFLTSLANIVEKRMPAELRRRLSEKGVKSMIPVAIQGFKIVLSLREDFVAQLDELRKKMPSVMHNRYPLHVLTGEQAMEVVLGPGEGIVTENVARKIVRIVAMADGLGDGEKTDFSKLTIEPNLLSLVCDELDQQRIKNGQSSISVTGLKDSSKGILRRFYRESFTGLPSSAKEFVEDELLTATGFRKSQPLDDAIDGGLGREAQKHLVDRHVLRILDRKDMPHLELTHDLLAGVVKESRDVRHETAKIEEARRKQRKRLVVLSLTSMVSLLLLVFFFITTLRAQKAEKRAEMSRQEAVKSRQEAEASRERAEEMIDFMANDLYDRLLPIGRTDILDEVALKVQSHLEQELDENKQTGSSLHTRAKALNKFANILSRRGNIREALATHRKSAMILENILEARSFRTVSPIRVRHSLVSTWLDRVSLVNQWVSPAEAREELSKISSLLAQSGREDQPQDVKAGFQDLLRREKLLRAEIQLSQGRPISALKTFLELKEASSGREDDVEVCRALSRCYRMQKNFPQALFEQRKALARIIELHEEEPANDDFIFKRAEILRDLGSLHLWIKDYEGARDKLEPALSIVNGHLQHATKNAGSNERNRWRYLAAETSLLLSKLWLKKAKDLKAPRGIGELKSFRLAGESLVVVQEWRKAIEATGRVDSWRIRHLFKCICEREAEMALAVEDLEVAMKAYEEAMSFAGGHALEDGEGDLTDQQKWHRANLRALIGSTRENFFNQIASPQDLITAIEAYDRLATRDSDNLSYQVAAGGALQQLALAHKQRGIIDEAISYQRDAVEYLERVNQLSEGRQLHQLRACIDARYQLGQLLADSGLNEEARTEFSYCAEQVIGSLRQNGFLRVEDRLRGADALYNQALASPGSVTLALMKSASDLGSQQATRWIIMDSDKSLSGSELEDLRKLAGKQARRRFDLPCQFVDELQAGEGTKITRKVIAEVIVAAPPRGAGKADTPIELENERLQRDFRLKIEPGVVREIKQRHSLASTSGNGKLSYADLTDNSGVQGNSEQQGLERNLLVKPFSPVRSVYPKRPPTVIGSECSLSWEYLGTGNGLHNFKLQISDSENFDTDRVEIIEGSGVRTRINFNDPRLKHLKNSHLYWRVKVIPKHSDPQLTPNSDNWSITREFEIYDSSWERIRHTNQLRVGISQFDGDLLELEGSGLEYTGFDGEILKCFGERIRQLLIAERPGLLEKGLGRDLPDPKKLTLKHYTYGWDGMFEAVGRNEVDFIQSIVTRTKGREQRFGIRFSEPYYETQLAFIYQDQDDGKVSIKDDPDPMMRLRDLEVAVNRGFRGHEVAKMITSNISPLDANLPQLLGLVKEGKVVGALTDLAFVIKQREANSALLSSLKVLPLNRSHYRRLWQLEYEQSTPDESVLEKLSNMESDYGSAEWEQYAVGVKDNEDTILMDHLNQIILDLRTDGSLRKFCEDASLPAPGRLLGPGQIPEERRRLATVVPLAPADVISWDGRSSVPAVVKGKEIALTWEPLGSNPKFGYRFQLSNTRHFSPHGFLVDEVLETPSITIHTSQYPDAKGTLFWRAKQLSSRVEKSSEDIFPKDRWCAPVEFQLYTNGAEKIKSTGVLRAGVAITNGFSVYKNSGKGEKLTGFDIEILKFVRGYLEEQMKVDELRIEWVPMQFSTLFPMVQNHQIDLAISGISALVEREEEYDLKFSRPYCRTRQAAIWLDDGSAKNVSDLRGKSFFVFQGTRGEKMAKNFEPGELLKTKSHPKAFLLEKLRSGKAMATITDYPAALKLLQEQPDASKFKLAPIMKSDLADSSINESVFLDKYAIPVSATDQKLLRLINEALTKLATDDLPLLKQIFQTHGVKIPKGLSLPPYELE